MRISVTFYNSIEENPQITESICILKQTDCIYEFNEKTTVRQFLYDMFNRYCYKCNLEDICLEMVNIYYKEFSCIFNLSQKQLDKRFIKVFEKIINSSNKIIIQDIPEYMGGGCWGESIGLRYIINSDEKRHENVPHVHVESRAGQYTDRVRIIEGDIMKTNNNRKPLSNKLRKEAIQFFQNNENKKKFLEYWNEFTNCKKKVNVEESIKNTRVIFK